MGGIVELSTEEGRALLDRSARRELGISGEEFLARWDAGEYEADGDGGYLTAGATAMLIPFARREK
jgi:hypothetical protein